MCRLWTRKTCLLRAPLLNSTITIRRNNYLQQPEGKIHCSFRDTHTRYLPIFPLSKWCKDALWNNISRSFNAIRSHTTGDFQFQVFLPTWRPNMFAPMQGNFSLSYKAWAFLNILLTGILHADDRPPAPNKNSRQPARSTHVRTFTNVVASMPLQPPLRTPWTDFSQVATISFNVSPPLSSWKDEAPLSWLIALFSIYLAGLPYLAPIVYPDQTY